MISPEYGAKLLNVIFGATGSSPATERNIIQYDTEKPTLNQAITMPNFVVKNVSYTNGIGNWDEDMPFYIPASVREEIATESKTDDEANEKATKQVALNKFIKKINGDPENGVEGLTYYEVFDLAVKPTSLEAKELITKIGILRSSKCTFDDGEAIETIYYGLVVRLKKTNTFPIKRYLALFTEMPDGSGNNYKELGMTEGTEAKTITYRRANLNKGYFTNDRVMGEAALNASEGGTTIVNNTTIYFPPTLDTPWASEQEPVVGFGIFDRPEIGEGSPYLWGKLSNTENVEIDTKKVPLFRKEQFIISMK